MTKKIKLSFGSETMSTAISNIFIDEYMAEAHGTYVKVYIYLLRCLSDPSMSISIAAIADKLDETEKDICKALKYWEKKKLLRVMSDEDGMISGITITDLSSTVSDDEEATEVQKLTSVKDTPVQKAVKETSAVVSEAAPSELPRPDYSAHQIAQLREEADDFNSLINYIEDKVGATLTLKELQTPTFLFESLAFPAELIMFLYDYCFSKGKRNTPYIEKVARDWAAKNVNSIDKAQLEVLSFKKEYSVLKTAFGLNRPLGGAELEYLTRWMNSFNMSDSLIKEACDRTILNIGKPDFKYADRILTKWHEIGVHSTSDIARLDEVHEERSKASRKPVASTNKFTQFPQRTYSQSEYADLERKKLNIN